MQNGLGRLKRAELIARNTRSAYDLIEARPPTPTTAPLAGVVPLVIPPPKLEHPPTTRVLDQKGRVSVRLGRRPLAEVMGWEPGALSVERDGAWVLLRPDPTSPQCRNDGRARLGADGRLRLPAPTQRLIAVAPGDEVAVLPLARCGVVALCHPLRRGRAVPPVAAGRRSAPRPARRQSCRRHKKPKERS